MAAVPVRQDMKRTFQIGNILVGLVKMSGEDGMDTPAEVPVGKARDLRLGQSLSKRAVCGFEPAFKKMGDPPEGQSRQNAPHNGAPDEASESQIAQIPVIDQVTMAEKDGIPVDTACGCIPGKGISPVCTQVEFMVARHESDGSAAPLPAAPGEEPVMVDGLISGKGNPQIEDIAEKHDIMIRFFNLLQEFPECRDVVECGVDMGIRNDQHDGQGCSL